VVSFEGKLMSMMRNGLLRHMMRREEVGKRSMGSSAHSHGGKNYPFAMHFDVSNIHKKLGLAYGTLLWLWVFWRAKQDGKVVLVCYFTDFMYYISH
jgi:hypothetical protein